MAALDPEEGAGRCRRRGRGRGGARRGRRGYGLRQDPRPQRAAAVRDPGGIHGLLQQQQDPGRPVRHLRPAAAALQPDPGRAPQRGGRGRGQELLARGRHLAHRHPAGGLLRPHQLRRQPAGRIHDHPAAGQELLRQHRDGADHEPQGQRDLRGAEAGPGEVQGVDPHPVPEHRLFRRRRVRGRRGRPVLLRPVHRPAQPDHAGPGRDDRRHDPEPQLLQPRPEGRRPLPGPGLPLALRADHHGQHGHAAAADRGQGDVPQGHQALQQQLGRLQGLHHAGGAQRTREHLRLLAGEDLQRRAAHRHHVQPVADELALRHGQPEPGADAQRQPASAGGRVDRSLRGGWMPAVLRPRRRGARGSEHRRDRGHVQRAELQQDPVRQRAPVPQPGGVLVQALCAVRPRYNRA